MSIIRKEQLTNPLSASYALTASYALNASTSTVDTGSLLTTASIILNTITFTKGNGSTFPIVVNTGSGTSADVSGFVTTSSFNAFTSSINQFTSSYNTGSFSGSFTGSFHGTASWAINARTASYVLSSNVSGPNGFDSVNYATNAGSAASVSSPLTQDLTIRGLLTNNIRSSDLSVLSQTLFSYSGFTIPGVKDAGVNIGDLVYLDPANIWLPVNQANSKSTKMLGIWVDDDSDYVLLEGDIVLDDTYITNPDYGLPVFISGSAGFTTDSSSFASGYIRVVGHTYYNDGNNWILRFKPSNDWTII